MNPHAVVGWIAIGCLCAGCESPQPDAATRPATQVSTPSRITITAHPPIAQDPRDPQPQLPAMVHLDIYKLDLPWGAVSNNAEFWKRIDEQSVGVADADRLSRNGMRCGTAPRSESLYFSKFFDQLPHHATRMTVDELHSNSIKLDVDKKFQQQDLFCFDAENQLQGHSYDAGTDELTLAYGPTPRDPGSVRLVFCPTVRSEKKHLAFTSLNDEFETPVSEVDHIHDASVQVDVADDSFFILAPGNQAVQSTSVGGIFLTRTDGAERLEHVFVVIPTFVRLDGKPITLPDLLVKTTTMPSQSPAR